MLSSTDTSIPCFHLPNRSFHLIVGSRKIFDIVALNQIGPPILQDTQKLLKAGAFRLTHSLFCDLLRYFLQKRIKTQSYFFIGKTLFLRTLIGTVTVLLSLRPSPIKNVLCIQYPLPHALDLLDFLPPALPFFHYLLETIQFPLGSLADWSPFFCSPSRLVATSSRASDAAIPA